MEILVTRNNSDELQHHGIKGMKWGRRLYQNKDGSLTPLGKKHYNKQTEKLKAEEAKIKAAEKAAKTKQRTQAKFDKLDAKKEELEARKKALKGKTEDKADKKEQTEETVEQKRERLLNSSDAKEIYKDRNVLTSQEITDRINRIDLENRLMSKIPTEPEKSASEWMDKATKNVQSATNLYKSVDSAFSTVKNSAIGKTLAKQLGIDLGDDKERESLSDFLKNAHKYSDEKIQKRAQTEANLKKLRDEEARQKKQAEKDANDAKAEAAKADKAKKAEEAKKQVDDYNERWTKGDSDDKVRSADSTYSKSGSDVYDDKVATGRGSTTERPKLTYTEKAKDDGKVYGEGTSKSTIKEQMDSGKKWWDTSGVADTVDYSSADTGRTYVMALPGYSQLALPYKED